MKNFFNNKLLQNKKLWLICATFAFLQFCLPIIANAHGNGISDEAVGWIIIIVLILIFLYLAFILGITILCVVAKNKILKIILLVFNSIVLISSILSIIKGYDFLIISILSLLWPLVNITILVGRIIYSHIKKKGSSTPCNEIKTNAPSQVNFKDSTGKTPLHHYIIQGQKDIAVMLISKGENINAKDNDGKTPLDYATDEEIKQLLIKAGAKSGKDL